MKKYILTLTIMLATFLAAFSQSSEQKLITKTIEMFSKAGDEQDADKLEALLNENYNVVMHQLFGSETTSLLPRAAYIEKIRNKEFGGDTRTITVEHMEVNGSTAVAKVLLKGSKMTVRSLFTLVKTKKGAWQLVSDMPVIV
ncbi:MAG: nuclear transport factor 2 family protein [Bacteroidota bacterium]